MSTLRSRRLRAGVTALAVTVVIVGALGAWQISAPRVTLKEPRSSMES